jgi:hypothetical protein
MKVWLELLGTIFGTLSFTIASWAALLWFRASMIEIPPYTRQFLGESADDSYGGEEEFVGALREQSRLNAKAAKFAALSAVLQGFALATGVFNR